MIKKLLLLVFTLFGVYSQITNAQSPYKLSLGKESLIIGTGFISAIASSSIDDDVTPLTEAEVSKLNKNDINIFDRSATNFSSSEIDSKSNTVLGVCAAAPILFLAGKESRNSIGTVSVMYLETMLFSVFTPSYAKGSVQRVRPFVYNENSPLDKKLTSEAKRSFFSGHTTNAFASAVFFSSVFSKYYPNSKWKPFVWGGSLLVASTVGFMRYRAGAHFPTDIIVGAAVGSAIGYLIPKLHETSNKSNLTFYPSIIYDKACLSFNYRF